MSRILCLIDSFGAGGAQRQMVGLAKSLIDAGYEVGVVCYHQENFYAESLESSGIPYVCLDDAIKPSKRIFAISRYIRKYRPDVVISYLDTPNICACIAKIFNNKFRLIVSERNTTQHTGLKEKIRFNLYRIADVVVPNAFSQEKYIVEHFPYLSNKVVTIPNFVDLARFTPAQNRIRHSKPEVMVAATIWPSKNTMGFIDAVASLKSKGYQFHVSWYGKDEANICYFNECQHKINTLGLTEYLELREKTTKINECYQGADYFCLPSFYEGTPNVIGEAMACGLPVACSDVCDNGRYVAEGENGVLFNPNDVTSMVNAFEKLFHIDDSTYSVYSMTSSEKAKKMLSMETFIASYLKLINK